MAQLILKNISPVLIQQLEQRARRSGRTVEAEALRVLEKAVATITADDDAPRQKRPSSQSEPASGARTLAHRQAELANAYPDEYVVLLGARLVIHTVDKEKAYAHYAAVLDEMPDQMPIVIPPGELRKAPPFLRLFPTDQDHQPQDPMRAALWLPDESTTPNTPEAFLQRLHDEDF